jgi:DNA-binding CsgD family transcriptional regulator
MYNEIKKLFEEGKTKSAIARELEVDRETVRKYLRMDVRLETNQMGAKEV